jgi:hypothetical protein
MAIFREQIIVGRPMRLLGLIPAILALIVSTAASAQDWAEYSNRENFFTVNFPGDPVETTVPYKTTKGTNLTAHVFTGVAPADTLLAGTYMVTVVDYSSVPDEIPTAVEQAAAAIRAKGVAKYDAAGNVDQMRSWRMTVETADKHRILAEILTAANNRLYIVQADTVISAPVPAQFQASVQILDENGVRIRYKTVGSTERVR